jgi:hypothetical protein
MNYISLNVASIELDSEVCHFRYMRSECPGTYMKWVRALLLTRQ